MVCEGLVAVVVLELLAAVVPVPLTPPTAPPAAGALASAAAYWLRNWVTSELALLWNSCGLIEPSPSVSMAATRELIEDVLAWLPPAADELRKLDSSDWLTLPLRFVSIWENNCCSVWARLDAPLLLALPM